MTASANLDLVRSIYAAWERGDFSSAEWADPEIEYTYADGPDPSSATGLDRMGESFRDYLSAWEGWGVAADEYRQLDDERVVVLYHFTGRGRASGMQVAQLSDARGLSLFRIRDGKVTQIVQYHRRDRAFADLGLKE